MLRALRSNSFDQYPISVAAAPDAFTFVGGDRAIAKAACHMVNKEADRATRDTIDAAIAKLNELMEDPIIFVQKDGLVAVVAQFGNFAPEKELIEKILSEPDII
ncbi:MAG: hypothetical protein HGA31_06090 [Candidatus Moranbacteria bacterium]|nr:hypothetical protein [Candidatus Moranbacteria bacterium]